MGATRKPDVMEFVEKAARSNPDISNETLMARAAAIDSDINDLSPRSFNARYPLQVKRRLKQEEDNKKTTEAAGEEELRSVVRETLLDFAKDVAGAQDHGKLMDVVMNVDEYVDRVMKKD